MTSILTALSLLAHVLTGCCWHHEHPCDAAPAEIAVNIGHAHGCGCSPHQGSEEPTAPAHDEAPCDEAPCDEDQCVTAFRDSAPGPWLAGALPAIVAEAVPQLAPMNLSSVSAPTLLDLAPPLRTHLLLQILLI